MYLAVSCFFQPLQDLGVKDFQTVKCPSGKKVTLDIFDHIFHFALAFRISGTAEHGLEMLLVDKGTERSGQYEVTQVFPDQQDFVLVIDDLSRLSFEIRESQFMGIYGQGRGERRTGKIHELLPGAAHYHDKKIDLDKTAPVRGHTAFPEIHLGIFPVRGIRHLLIDTFGKPLLVQIILTTYGFHKIVYGFPADNRKIRILFLHPVMNLGGGQEPVPGKNVTDITFVFVKYAGISPAMLQFCSQCVLIHFQVPAHRTSMQTKLERNLTFVKSF